MRQATARRTVILLLMPAEAASEFEAVMMTIILLRMATVKVGVTEAVGPIASPQTETAMHGKVLAKRKMVQETSTKRRQIYLRKKRKQRRKLGKPERQMQRALRKPKPTE